MCPLAELTDEYEKSRIQILILHFIQVSRFGLHKLLIKAPVSKHNPISTHISNPFRLPRSRNSPLLHPASYSNG